MKIQKLDSKIFQFIKNNSIAVLIIGAAILFYSCENDIQEIKAFSSPENLPTLEASNFQTLFTDSGQVRFFMKAPKLMRFESEGLEYLEFPQGIEIVKYDAKHNVTSSITADYAKQFVKEQKYEAKNNVVATNAQGDTLKTEHLILEEKTEKIYTEEFVKIIRPDQIITGIGFTSDQEMINWKIRDPKGIIYVNVDNQKKRNKPASLDSNQNRPVPLDKPLKFE